MEFSPVQSRGCRQETRPRFNTWGTLNKDLYPLQFNGLHYITVLLFSVPTVDFVMAQQSVKLTLTVQAPYLTQLRSGAKRYEGRLARPKYVALQPGDYIKIEADDESSIEDQDSSIEDPDSSTEDQDSSIEDQDSSIFQVKSVKQYATFRTMLNTHSVGAFLPDRDEGDVDGAVDLYRGFPGYEKGEKKLGVVGIEVVLVA